MLRSPCLWPICLLTGSHCAWEHPDCPKCCVGEDFCFPQQQEDFVSARFPLPCQPPDLQSWGLLRAECWFFPQPEWRKTLTLFTENGRGMPLFLLVAMLAVLFYYYKKYYSPVLFVWHTGSRVVLYWGGGDWIFSLAP